MPSNHTTNYQLNQWARPDQVKMEDFNADNARIDAAIKAVDTKAEGRALQSALDAEAGARAALEARTRTLETAVAKKADSSTVSEVSGRAGARLLSSGKVSSTVEDYLIPTSNINWSQWKTVYLIIRNPTSRQLSVCYQKGSTSFYLYGTVSAIIMHPFFDADMPVVMQVLTVENRERGVHVYGRNFSDFPLWLGGSVAAGTTYEFWGEK